jgi:hypothetical protein
MALWELIECKFQFLLETPSHHLPYALLEHEDSKN